MIELWRKTPCQIGGQTPSKMNSLVFPSGRQALSKVLEKANVTRSTIWGVPDYMGACVLSTISRTATPCSISKVVSKNIDGVLVYEQWGWQKPQAAYEQVRVTFRGKPIIWDRVDTLNETLGRYLEMPLYKNEYQVTSLSKGLGLFAGGLAIGQDGFFKFERSPEKNIYLHLEKLCLDQPGTVESGLIVNFLKDNITHLPQTVVSWLRKNDLEAAMKREWKERQNRLRTCLQIVATRGNYPKWMISQAENLEMGRPGIFPIFLDDLAKINRLSALIAENFGVRATPYHFDTSESFLESRWQVALALPLHSDISTSSLENVLGFIHGT